MTRTCRTRFLNLGQRSHDTVTFNLTLTNVTITSRSPRRDGRALQAKALVVSPVDVFHQFVHVCRVALAGHF